MLESLTLDIGYHSMIVFYKERHVFVFVNVRDTCNLRFTNNGNDADVERISIKFLEVKMYVIGYSRL